MRAIYIKGQDNWVGVDPNKKEVDGELFEELKVFLEDYFCNDEREMEESSQVI